MFGTNEKFDKSARSVSYEKTTLVSIIKTLNSLLLCWTGFCLIKLIQFVGQSSLNGKTLTI